MTVNGAFRLKDVAGEQFLIDTSGGEARLDRVFRLSPSAVWLWKNASGCDFREADLVEKLCEEFSVPRDKAADDVRCLLTDWEKYGIVR